MIKRFLFASGLVLNLMIMSVTVYAAPFAPITVDVLKAPWGKDFSDVDGDGDLDIVVGGGFVFDELVYWYRYPDFSMFPLADRGGGENHIVIDVNNDGAQDVVVTGGSSAGGLPAEKAVAWYENPRGKGGDPTLRWTRHEIGPGVAFHDILVRDIDGDGRLDVAGREAYGSTRIYLQSATDVWTHVPLTNALDSEGSLVVGGIVALDINRDGRLDIVGPGYWLEQPTNAVSGVWARHDYAERSSGDYRYSYIATGDLNGDGREDIIEAEFVPYPSELFWVEVPDDPINDTWVRHDFDVVEKVHQFRITDMDRDGDLDIVLAEQHDSVTRRMLIYYNVNHATSWSQQVISINGAHNITVGDVDGDGDKDLLGGNWDINSPDTGAIVLWLNGSPVDNDGDGVEDASDNCTIISNADQRDTDGDGYGNRCDPDLNNDNIVNGLDTGLMRQRLLSADPDADFNGDGIVNGLDTGILRPYLLKAPGPSGKAP